MSTKNEETGKTKVHLALIAAIQGIVGAIIAAAAQYFTTVAPLKAEVERLKQDPPTVGARPHEEAKKTFPPGKDLGFRLNFLHSRKLLERENSWAVDDEWDARCKEIATAQLIALNFSIVPIQSPWAARGERNNMHLGVQCFAEFNFMAIYALQIEDESQGQEQFDQLLEWFTSAMKYRYKGDLF